MPAKSATRTPMQTVLISAQIALLLIVVTESVRVPDVDHFFAIALSVVAVRMAYWVDEA